MQRFFMQCLLLLVACLEALPTGASEEASGEVQVWAWNIAAASLEKLAPTFKAQYPDVDITVTMNGTNMQSRFLLSLSAGVGAPDVSQLQLVEAPYYAQTLRLTDLTPLAAKYEHQFPASFWQNCVYEGRVYAIPWDMGPCAVFYKRHLFKEHGIDPNAIETWADYIAAGKRIVEASGGKTKMLFLPTGGLEVLFEILLQQTGGQIFDEEGRVAIGSPEVRTVIELLQTMLASGIGANALPWQHSFYASLKSDAVATYPLAAWFGGTIRDHAPETAGDWGVFRLPAIAPGGLRTSNYGGSVLVIPDQSAHKEAAWTFVEYALCTREGQLQQFRNFDLFPGLVATHQDPFFGEGVDFFGGQKTRRLFSEDIERIPALNRTRDWQEAIRYIRQDLSAWASAGMGDPEGLLANLERKLARRLNRPVAPKEAGSAVYSSRRVSTHAHVRDYRGRLGSLLRKPGRSEKNTPLDPPSRVDNPDFLDLRIASVRLGLGLPPLLLRNCGGISAMTDWGLLPSPARGGG